MTIDELLVLVNIVLGAATRADCLGLFGDPSVADVIQGVNSALTGCPLRTPTPTATPFLTPTPSRYQLLEGSTIAQIPAAATDAEVIEEPLSGTFLIGNPEPALQYFVVYDLLQLEFQSPSFSITLDPSTEPGSFQIPVGIGAVPSVFIDVVVSINGQRVHLFGRGAITCCEMEFEHLEFRRLESIELCGSPAQDFVYCDVVAEAGGYRLRLGAELIPAQMSPRR